MRVKVLVKRRDYCSSFSGMLGVKKYATKTSDGILSSIDRKFYDGQLMLSVAPQSTTNNHWSIVVIISIDKTGARRKIAISSAEKATDSNHNDEKD